MHPCLYKCVCAAAAGALFLPSAAPLTVPQERYGSITDLPAATGEDSDPSYFFSATKVPGGDTISDDGFVHLVFRYVPHDEDADAHDGHDHGRRLDDHDGHDHGEEEEEDHDGHDHDEEAARTPEELTAMHAAAVAFYEAAADSDCGAPFGTGLLVTNDFTCNKITLPVTTWETALAMVFTGDEAAEARMIQYTAFFTGHPDADEDEEDDHDGHDHDRRRLDDHDGHDHGEEEEEDHDDHGDVEMHYDELFYVKNANTGAVLTPVSMDSSQDMDDHDDHGEESASVGGNKGMAMFASFCVNMVTLVGVIFLIPFVRKMLASSATAATAAVDFEERGMELANKPDAAALGSEVAKPPPAAPHAHGQPSSLEFVFSPNVIVVTSAFSSGAILACAFLLVLPEAFHLIDSNPDVYEATLFWHWGSCIMGGFLFPYLLAAAATFLFPVKEGDAVDANAAQRIRIGVLVGDAFHNFADGCFIGAAFMSCDTAFGWTVAISTIAHEIAQEVADFFVLTSHGKMTPFAALALNFAAGLSVMLGALVIVNGDLGDDVLGYVLAIGGGIYIQIGAAECIPRAFEYAKTVEYQLKAIFVFFVGAVLIGLVLLDHEHCPADGHEGHNH